MIKSWKTTMFICSQYHIQPKFPEKDPIRATIHPPISSCCYGALPISIAVKRPHPDKDTNIKNKVKHAHNGQPNPEAEGASNIHHQIKQVIRS